MNSLLFALIACLGVGIATFVGAMPVFFARRLDERLTNILLGFGGGVMLCATAFSLIAPGTDSAIAQNYGKWGASGAMSLGIAIGGLVLAQIHRLFPHEHFFKGLDGKPNNTTRTWLFITAITLHNFPEGLAVGVSFGNDNLRLGLTTALGISLQNIPEGFIVAMSLLTEGYSLAYALWISLLTGLVEPIGGIVGIVLVNLASSFLPWAMAFAAGAMLFVICDEIIPETHRRGLEHEGTIGIMAGFVVMMILDIIFA